MALRIVLAGGGTGGHVTPALALGEALRAIDPAIETLFVGSDRGLEARLVPDAGFELVTLRSRQVMGRGLLGRLAGAAAIALASLAAWRLLGRRRIHVVVSVGGYAAMPCVVAALLRRVPLVLVEPNAIPGRVNRLAARFATRVFAGFEATGAALAGRVAPSRLEVSGVPLRRRLVDAASASGEARRAPSPPIHLLVFGGSQGAHQINQAIVDALPELAKLPLHVVHQTGEADREEVVEAYRAQGLDAEVLAFEPDMPARYARADLALCRAGALTVAELALSGLPALLVPYPYAADDHQRANARALEEAGAARCLDARDLEGRALAGLLAELVADPGRLAAMGRAARAQARPEAADRVARLCIALAAGRAERRR